MIEEVILLRFWDAVVECLVKFHHLDYAEAHQEVIELRVRLRESDREMAKRYNLSLQPDFDSRSRIGFSGRHVDTLYPSYAVYHEEPFYVAYNLMGRQLSLEEHSEQYDNILMRHGW